jgi:hypothetical protein
MNKALPYLSKIEAPNKLLLYWIIVEFKASANKHEPALSIGMLVFVRIACCLECTRLEKPTPPEHPSTVSCSAGCSTLAPLVF